MAIQQLMLGAGGPATEKTYVDNVFNTYAYIGNGATSRNITTNVDLVNNEGMVWYKQRSGGQGHRLADTVRGATKVIESYDTTAEVTESTGLNAFLNNGFTIGNEDNINQDTEQHVAWTFRHAPGFFDVVTYEGNGSNRTLAHSLGCVPGCIMIHLMHSH